MEKLIAQCGLDCNVCEAFIATKKNDMAKKAEIAKKWSKAFNIKITAEDVNCVGCRIEGLHIGYCSQCEVRKCGISSKTEICAFCNEYPACSTLETFFKMIPGSGADKIKKTLDEIKKNKK